MKGRTRLTASYTITPNPGAPSYVFTEEWQNNYKRQIAPFMVQDLIEGHPNADSHTVCFDGVPYAGRVSARGSISHG